jgi:hypothetical protein
MKRLMLILICLFTSFYNTKAEMQFNSAKLKNVFGLLPEDYKIQIQSRLSSSSEPHILDGGLIGDKCKLVYRFNEYQELDHLGLYIIENDQYNKQFQEVSDYLERAFLVSALLNEKYPLTQEAKNCKIEVLYNGSLLNKQNNRLVIPGILIDKDTPVRINYDSKFFFIKWKLDSLNILEVKIPNNYSLITEKTKDELEKDILRKFNQPQIEHVFKEKPSFNQLELFKENIYLLHGEMYFFVTDLSSSKYYFVKDSIRPVFNSKFYKESVCNLFLNVIPTKLDLKLTQKLYGGNEKEFRININSFFENFASEYKVFFGWLNDDKENLEASVLICNKVYNYNHLLKISTNSKSVFRKIGEIEGMFFAYIPRENLN